MAVVPAEMNEWPVQPIGEEGTSGTIFFPPQWVPLTGSPQGVKGTCTGQGGNDLE